MDPPDAQQGSTSTPTAATLAKEKKKKHQLNAQTDPIYAELRDLNFSSVGRRLNKTARRLDEDYKVSLFAKNLLRLIQLDILDLIE